MLRTNEKNLVEFLLQCKPGPPPARKGISVDHKGIPFYLPGIGGITLNIKAGDSAFNWEGDHLEPGVSCRAGNNPFENPNKGLQTFSCAGNIATIISGKAIGEKGIIIGHHGGSEHIIIDFDRKTKEIMTYDDKIMVKAVGMGLKLLDYPNIKINNLSPALLSKMKIKENKKTGILNIPVTTIIPSELMGSGIGIFITSSGDYDIMTSDPELIKKYNIDKIRFGDFVALLDQDNSYGRCHRGGAITIGIVIHSNCLKAGHGPGVTTLFTSSKPLIKPIIDPKANIANLLINRNKKK